MKEDQAEGQEYLRQKKIPELFKSLTVGLVYHRPDDPVLFLKECLDKARNLGDEIWWDSFLPRRTSLTPYSQISPIPGASNKAGTNSKAGDHAEEVSEGVPRQDSATNKIQEQIIEEKPVQGSEEQKVPKSHFEDHLKSQVSAASLVDTTETQARGAESQASRSTSPEALTEDRETLEPKVLEACVDKAPLTAPQTSVQEEHGQDAETEGKEVKKTKASLEQDPVMKGSLNDLPPMQTNIVRIFLSSTFSDFKAERNILPREAYPALREYCSERGLEFQVMDMRWGVSDDVINDHQVSELCIKEVDTCRQLSCGPNFVTLLGNRYGFRPFPAKISKEEFETLHSIAKEAKLSDADLLSDWFLEDQNAIPSMYVLQPIDSKLQYYSDMKMENKKKRKDHVKAWKEVFARLQHTLENAANIAHDKGLISDMEKKKYMISVTEEEVHHGILLADNAEEKALCFVREMKQLEKNTNDPMAARYIDVTDDRGIDPVASELRTELVKHKLPEKLHGKNIREYETVWKGKSLEVSEEEEHRTYLQKFCQDFVEDMIHLIQKNLTEEQVQNKRHAELYEEVLHHAKFARAKIETFCGRQDILDAAQQYVKTRQAHQPLVIYGKSGYGKTSVLAYIANCIPEWIGPTGAVIMRFLGTSPQSSELPLMLKSVILQICVVTGTTAPEDSNMQTMGDIRRTFWTLLKQKIFKQPLVIILDSLDQLSELYGAHRMVWIPKAMNSNVFIILSVLSDRFDCLANIRERIEDPKWYLELKSLPQDTGKEIIETYLARHQRTLQAGQKEKVLQALEECSQPLFLKLVLDMAKLWNSYTPVEDLHITTSAHSAIILLFENLEHKYGNMFTSNALGYLTSGKGGLTGVEMEDILSCDDQVLNIVYQYHDPPLEGTIRIPSLLWARVENEMKEYLAERRVDGKTVMTWYHRQFWEAAEERYVTGTNRKQDLHKALADLYMQEHGLKRTITLHQRKGKVIQDADRQITPQPLIVKNVRKLNALPYHLLHCGETTLLKSQCLLNFNWILVKLLALGATNVASEYDLMLKSDLLNGDKELEVFGDFLQLCFGALRNDPKLLAYEIIARLKGVVLELDLIKKLVNDADAWMQSTDKALLIPVHPVNYQTLESPLKFHIVLGCDGVVTSDESTLVCNWLEHMSADSKIQTFNLKTRDMMASVPTYKGTPFALTPDEKYFAFVERKVIKLCEIETGDIQKQIQYRTEEYDKTTVRDIACSTNGEYIACGVRCGKPTDADEKRWQQRSRLYVVSVEKKEMLAMTELRAKKHIDRLCFVNEDRQIIAVTKDKIFVMVSADLSPIYTVSEWDDIEADTLKVFPTNKSLLVARGGSNKRATIIVYNYDTDEKTQSENISISEKKACPFGLYCDVDGTKIAVGTSVKGEDASNTLCIWNRSTDQYSHVSLQVGWKAPSALVMNREWSVAIVGWDGGNISLVDVASLREVGYFKGHGHQVTNLYLLSEGKKLLTMGKEHTVKIWDMQRLQAQVAQNLDQKKLIDFDQPAFDRTYLNEREEVLHITVADQFLISSPPENDMIPRFWDLETGNFLKSQSKQIGNAYREKMKDDETKNFGKRTFGTVEMVQDKILVYGRKTRDKSLIHVCTDIYSTEAPSVQQMYLDTFYTVLFPPPGKSYPKSNEQNLVVVGNGVLQVYDLLSLTKKKEIEIPKMTDNIVNIETGGGKKKLLMMKYALTLDGKYFLIMNALPKRDKYMDLINLEEGKYVQRYSLDEYTSVKYLDDSLFYLVLRSDRNPQLFQPTGMKHMRSGKETMTYSCLLTLNAEEFLSYDGTLGAEKRKNHSLNIWQLDPLTRLRKVGFHDHEISTCSWTRDNKYIATGSFDGTAKIWSLESGEQLSMFCAYGAINCVRFSLNGQNLMVHYFAAPQRRSAMILKCRNLQDTSTGD